MFLCRRLAWDSISSASTPAHFSSLKPAKVSSTRRVSSHSLRATLLFSSISFSIFLASFISGA